MGQSVLGMLSHRSRDGVHRTLSIYGRLYNAKGDPRENARLT